MNVSHPNRLFIHLYFSLPFRLEFFMLLVKKIFSKNKNGNNYCF